MCYRCREDSHNQSSHCGDYENPNETQENQFEKVEMTVELARKRNLDIYTLPRTWTSQCTVLVASFKAAGREVFRFEEEATYGGHTFKLLYLAVGPRKNAGQTAKTVRRFIKGE